MIELNKKYTTKELAKECDVSYGQFRNRRADYEEHLQKFYDMLIEHKGSGIYYIFNKELYPYVSYREYKSMQKNKVLQKHIKDTIHYDNRQTGSNIARIIVINGEIQALNWQLSTLTVYVRDELKELVQKGYYQRNDYRWCYLDKEKNQYVLMSNDEVERLRSYFRTRETDETEENILSAQEQGSISQEEANNRIANLRRSAFMQGRTDFQTETGYWPIKVPVYERCAWANQ